MLRFLLLSLLLAGCAQPQPSPDPQIPLECQDAFVILPDNFVIDLAAGSTVRLDPGAQEFALFCTPEKADQALRKTAPHLPGGWRVYRLRESLQEVGRPAGREEFILARPAELEDWVEIQSESGKP